MTLRLRSTVGARGQTVIPKAIRDQLKLRAGDPVWFRLEDERIVIEREDPLAAVEAFITECPKRDYTHGTRFRDLLDEQHEAKWPKRKG